MTVQLVSCLLDMVLALLVAQLADPSFRKREAAYRGLGRVVALARPHLELASRGADAEAARRAALLLAPIWHRERLARAERLSRELRPKGWDKAPWLYTSSHGWAHDDWVDAAQKTVCSGHPEYLEFREATCLYLRSQLLSGRPVRELQEELEEMARQEERWRQTNGR